MPGSHEGAMRLNGTIAPGAVAIVTGAGRGIGEAIAHRLAAAGAAVCVGDRDAEAAEKVATELRADGHRAIATDNDVSDPRSCEATVTATVEELGAPTILVNNAGVTRSGFLHKMSDEDWLLVNDVILRGTFNVTRAAARYFRSPEPADRRIVNISSIAGVHGASAGVNYCAAKAGVIGITKAMSAEWAAFGVTVNAIAPGLIDTRMLNESVPAAMLDKMTERVPIGRMGRPDDIAAAAAFLCSREAGYITSQVLEVHGGFTDLTPAGQEMG